MKTKIVLFGMVFLMMLSCSRFKEVYYFKDKIAVQQNEKAKVPNYYRVTIKGYSFLSSSRYVSGYFNQNALNLYFNQIKQTEDAKLFNTKKDVDGNLALVTNEDGNELVLVFSSSAKAIADQIGSIAKNQTILNSIAQITQKDKIREALTVKTDLNMADVDIQNYTLTTDLYLKDLDKKTVVADITITLDQYIKSLLK